MIPRQRADLALTEVAEQTNKTLIFPFDGAKQRWANAVNGWYTLQEGLDHLLRGTALKVSVGDNGQIKILITKSHSGGTETMHKLSKLSAAILAISSTAYSINGAAAQDGSASLQEEEVLVLGIRGSLQRAADIKREASGVVDAISSEDIGKFPDTNLAESLQRISGVSIDRSGGEGQFVTVRGFGPEFNTVLVNGRQMPSDNPGREFSFDLLASELVSGVEVNKTANASLQSGGIGSTINIKTAKPLDIDEFKFAGSVKGLYDSNSSETSPQISGLISNTFADGKFGALLSFSHQERETQREQAAIEGWIANTNIASKREGYTPTTANTFVPRNYEQRVIAEDRTRTGGNLVLQFAPNDSLELTADVLYSKFDVESKGSSLGHWFTSSDFSNTAENPITVDSNGTVVNFLQDNGATDFGARDIGRPSETISAGLNAKWQVNDNFQLAFDYSKSSSELNDSKGNTNPLIIFGFLDNVVFDHTQSNLLPGLSGFQEANPNYFNEQQNFELRQIAAGTPRNTIDVSEPIGRGNYLDPSTVRSHVNLRRGSVIDDEIDQFKVDGDWSFDNDKGLISAKFGVLYSDQSKSNTFVTNEIDGRHCVTCGYFDRVQTADGPTGAPINIPLDLFSVLNAGGDFLSDLSGASNIPNQWLRFDQEAAFNFIETATGGNLDAEASGTSFVVNEEIFATYVKFEYQQDIGNIPMSAHLGLRYETTDVDINGTNTTLESLNILDQTELGQINGPLEPIRVNNSYNHFLPNLDIKFDLSDTIVSRFAVSKTITRPALLQLSPGITIQTTRQGGDFRASSGNPELEPLESTNLDLSFEWYYGDADYISAGYFRKDVTNFIVSNTRQDSFQFTSPSSGQPVRDPSSPQGTDPNGLDDSDGIALFDFTTPNNGEDAVVDGFELAIQHNFGETGFGILANLTVVDSDSDLNVNDLSQSFAVTGLSDSQNIVGFYEKGPFQIRLAWNNREGFLQSLTQIQGSGPTFVDDYHQWDLSGSYDINDSLTVFFEGINITEEILLKHGRYSNQFLLADDTGARWSLGLRATF